MFWPWMVTVLLQAVRPPSKCKQLISLIYDLGLQLNLPRLSDMIWKTGGWIWTSRHFSTFFISKGYPAQNKGQPYLRASLARSRPRNRSLNRTCLLEKFVPGEDVGKTSSLVGCFGWAEVRVSEMALCSAGQWWLDALLIGGVLGS